MNQEQAQAPEQAQPAPEEIEELNENDLEDVSGGGIIMEDRPSSLKNNYNQSGISIKSNSHSNPGGNVSFPKKL